MEKELFSKITFERKEESKEVKIYKLKDEKYGIEIDTISDNKVDIKKVEQLTLSEEKIDRLLEILIVSAENFTLLEDFAYDFSDCKESIF